MFEAGAPFRAKVQGGDSTEALKENARGILIWQVCPGTHTIPPLCCATVLTVASLLEGLLKCLITDLPTLQAALSRGLLPDDETLKQLVLDPELPLTGRDISTLRWPEEPLRYVLTSKWNATTSPLSGLATVMASMSRASLCHSCHTLCCLTVPHKQRRDLQDPCPQWVSADSAKSTQLC